MSVLNPRQSIPPPPLPPWLPDFSALHLTSALSFISTANFLLWSCFNLPRFDLETHRRCLEMDYSEDTVGDTVRQMLEMFVYFTGWRFKRITILFMTACFCCCCWSSSFLKPILNHLCQSEHTKRLIQVRAQAIKRRREIESVCLELDMRNCGASALSLSRPQTARGAHAK